MAERGAFEIIVAEVGKFALPLRNALASPEAFGALMLELGWEVDDIPQPFTDLIPDLENLIDKIEAISGGDLSFDGSIEADEGGVTVDVSLADVADAIEAVANVYRGIEALADAPNSAFPAALIADGFKAEIAGQLVSHLTHEYLRVHRSGVAFALQTLGATKVVDTDAVGNRPDYVDVRLTLSDIPKIFESPETLLQNAFGWGGPDFDYELLQSTLDDLAASLDRRVVFDGVDTETALLFEDGADVRPEKRRTQQRIVFFERGRPTGRLFADLSLMELPATGSKKAGFALLPAFNGVLDVKTNLGPNIAVTLKSDLDAQGGIGLLARPDTGIDMLVGFDGGNAPSTLKGSGTVDLEFIRGEDAPFPLLGKADGTRLEVNSASGSTGFILNANQEVEVFAEIETEGLAFEFDPSSSDGFIGKILSGVATRFEFDMGLGISYPHGVYFRGTSNLEIQVPTHIDLGPIEVQGLTIALKPDGDALPIDIGATFKAQLGPMSAVIENIGLRTNLAFPDGGGNLGPVNLDFGLKPPNGVGLSIDAGPVKGGGYLFIDADKGEYAGALELRLLGFLSVSAIGIINTKLPDGSRGFSFLAIISAEFNPGFQLGFGFTLLGVGGLVGLNRSMDLDALVAGIKAGAIDSVLFPQDVVANAPRIISDLRSFFPPEEDTFLVGPMAKLGWGTPTLIKLSLGIIIEIPGNIAIVGKLTVAIPDERVPLIIINVAFMGALEFDKKRGWFFANIYDSRVIYLTLDGGMGVLAAFGNDAEFIISVGGVHPSYNPPSLPFPPLSRIGIDLLNTPAAKVRVEAYFALTSNTVQFGARAELYFGISIARIEGHIAFDALFQFSPFYFTITISASLSVKLFGAGLFSVRFRGALEGTSPWHIEGRGSISILWWDVGVDFSKTWGNDEDTRLPPISVMPILIAEFEKVENWTASLDNQEKLLVTLKTTEAADELVLHPTGSLRVVQRAIPLGLTLDKIGNQRPDDANHFTVSAGSTEIEERRRVDEAFAIGQYQDLSDAEKLSASDYVDEEAGLELSINGNQTNTSFVTKKIARYEKTIVDNNFKRAVVRFFMLVPGLFTHFLAGNAATKGSLSFKAQDEKHLFDPKITVAPNAFMVVSAVDNTPMAGAEVAFTSRAQAQEFLSTQPPGFAKSAHIVRPHEMKQAA